MDLTGLMRDGWVDPFDDPSLAGWLKHAGPVALRLAQDPDQIKAWLRHGGTWYAGVNALPNDTSGKIGEGPALAGSTVDALRDEFGAFEWDKAQVSGVYAGYPKQDADESDAAHAFRKNRCAAHVDGLVPHGPQRRRFVTEPHAFVLGLPVTDCDAGASPMVVWKGSHLIMQRTFAKAFHGVDPSDWSDVDITDVYAQARRTCFEMCERHTLHARPGQAYVLHRHVLHGVLPWQDGAKAPSDGRVILYFRPEMPGGIEDWLAAP